ncbi:hypothetical protein [Enterobacter sp. NFIX58]|uniref:hypothetical protein n=1 Tax=Enterobacter sp. NFIX58 TaxID=1566251 RepID=UPI0008D7D576|nr:hypothetical protein [Enterobacter sp. NFIX58]SEP40355.1 hypothetical protein SAMN03159286_0178 [Enterobacter sp. NFIX58]
MKLIDILVRELPDLGGWPPSTESLYQNAKGRLVGTQGCIVNTVDMKLSVVAEDTHRSVTRQQYEATLAASKPEWDGEGLPPVGCECEYKDAGTEEWMPVEIKYSSNQIVVFSGRIRFRESAVEISKDVVIDNPQFRPIRSEADRKRDSIISKIEKAYKDCPHSDAVPRAIYEVIAEHIRID